MYRVDRVLSEETSDEAERPLTAVHCDHAYGVWSPRYLCDKFTVAVNGFCHSHTCHMLWPLTAVYGVYSGCLNLFCSMWTDCWSQNHENLKTAYLSSDTHHSRLESSIPMSLWALSFGPMALWSYILIVKIALHLSIFSPAWKPPKNWNGGFWI